MLMINMGKRSTEAVLKALLEVLSGADHPLSTREIARRARVDWATAEKHLSFIHKWFSVARGMTRFDRPNLTLWRLERVLVSGHQEALRVRIGKGDAEWAAEMASRMKGVSPSDGLRMATELSNSAMGFHGPKKIKMLREERSKWPELRLLCIE
jgi:hypothetical protein